MVIGSDAAAHVVLAGAGVAGRHAVVQGTPDGQAAIRLAGGNVDVRVNGVRLGPQPIPLLHGDKVEIGGTELLFVDERRSGSTQYMQAVDPSLMEKGKPAARAAPGGTGGSLVSLTDGREYVLHGRPLVIGREAGCDVVLDSAKVSRRHAELLMSARGYVLVDSSTNGTFVNGDRVHGEHLLARGDVLRIGDDEFRFHADVPKPTPPPASTPPRAPVAAAPPHPQPPSPLRAGPPPGAAERLSHTLHGLPAVPRPAVPGPKSPTPATPRPPVHPAGAPKPVADALAYLIVRSGPLKGQRFPIKVPIVNVGRADYNDVVLPDDSVSTTHAKIQRREGIWVLVDLDSTNGTLVDGERVSGEVPLAPGALVRIGQVQTIFEPTDDTVDSKKGSSTRLMSAVRLPDPPPDKPQR
jgi:pSer/pThr/pTyr-binding forkhead associated (FHA) protein